VIVIRTTDKPGARLSPLAGACQAIIERDLNFQVESRFNRKLWDRRRREIEQARSLL
jgi:hypothetical protein